MSSKPQANLEQTPSGSSKPLSAALLRLFGQAETLLGVIQLGARLGYTARVAGANPQRVAGLLAGAGDSGLTEDSYEAQCRRAGPVTTLAAVVETYQGVLAQLEGQGEDVFPWRAALEVALAHHGGEQVTAQGQERMVAR